jgi:hypothetical protein
MGSSNGKAPAVTSGPPGNDIWSVLEMLKRFYFYITFKKKNIIKKIGYVLTLPPAFYENISLNSELVRKILQYGP